MKISKETKNGLMVCSISGEVNIDNSQELRKTFDEFIAAGNKKVIVDCAGLDYIDSSGLATLIEMLQRLKKVGGQMKICCLNDKVKSVFEITKLNTLFSISDSLAGAQEGM